MSKRYKIWMFVLLGVGAVMIIGGLSSFGESAGLAIFGIIGGLIVALPMLLLYKPLLEKKKEEERKKQRKEEKAKRAGTSVIDMVSVYGRADSVRCYAVRYTRESTVTIRIIANRT